MRYFLMVAAMTLGVGAEALPTAAEAQSWRDRGSVRSEVRREARRDVRRGVIREHHRREQRKNALIGAGVGMLGGAILSDGDPWATVAGAAAGGVVGHVATDRPRPRYRRDHWRY